ncbi:MAG: hypothetical protein K1X67_08310 [Fimbriimonadaceae bacterium]|nr:hypothetical protein [Fimbriimonadaceae bacterium]
MTWTTGVLGLVLLLLQWFRMRSFKPSFLSVQFATSIEGLQDILDRWTPDQRSTHTRMLLVDFVALACYGSWGYLASTAPNDAWLVDVPAWLRQIVPFLMPAAAFADACENVCLLWVTAERPSSFARRWFLLAKFATIAKFGILIAFLLIFIAYTYK